MDLVNCSLSQVLVPPHAGDLGVTLTLHVPNALDTAFAHRHDAYIRASVSAFTARMHEYQKQLAADRPAKEPKERITRFPLPLRALTANEKGFTRVETMYMTCAAPLDTQLDATITVVVRDARITKAAVIVEGAKHFVVLQVFGHLATDRAMHLLSAFLHQSARIAIEGLPVSNDWTETSPE